MIYSFEIALIRKAHDFYERGEYLSALNVYHRMIQMNPDLTQAWSGKGLALLELKDYHKSIYCYQQVLKQDPQNAGAWNNSAVCYSELGFIKAAIRRYKKAIELQVEQKSLVSHAFLNLVETYQELGRVQDALLVADQWIRLDPKCLEAYEVRNDLLNEGKLPGVARLRTRTGFEWKELFRSSFPGQ